MKIITAQQLQKMMDDKAELVLIDVREPFEHEDFNIGGQLMPLSQIVQHMQFIDTEKPVILYCRKGIRSQLAIQKLQEKFPFNNLFNLEGGMESWKKHFNINNG